MTLSNLFELVRKEEVVLWAGSGMSKYAGYPMGRDLRDMLFDALSKEEQKEVSESFSLADMAEQFIRLKSGNRTQLEKILRNVFLRKPTSTKYHDLIANIPHIKTVITTNYDNLFELAYRGKAIKILEQKDIGRINGQSEIFKIHGDFDNEKSLIIAKSDYARFFARDESGSLIWSVIAERISNKTILFIGYDLEDDNVINFLDKIWDSLKENRREAVLIAPGLKKHKIAHLKSKGINYINFSAEPFVEKLNKNIGENILADHKKGFVHTDTLRSYLLPNNLDVKLQTNGNKISVAGVKSAKGKMRSNVSFSFNDVLLKQKFARFSGGEEFGQLEFDNRVLTDLKLTSGHINLLDGDFKDYKLILMSHPAEEGETDISFRDGFELNDVHYKIFSSRKKIVIEATYKGLFFEISCFDPTNTNIKEIRVRIKGPDRYETTTAAINISNFLLKFSQGMTVYIHPKMNNKKYEFASPSNDASIQNMKQHLEFYEVLKQIESLYILKFRNVPTPTLEIYEEAMLALNAVKNQKILAEWEGPLQFDLNRPDISLELLMQIHGQGSMQVYATEPEIVSLFGNEIHLGYKVITYKNLKIINLKEVVAGKTNLVKMNNETKEVQITYRKENIQDRIG